MQRTVFDADQEAFRSVVREFLAREVVPVFGEWERAGRVPRSFYRRAGELGMTSLQVPEKFGGGGAATFKYNCVMNEEAQHALVNLGGLRVHLDVALPYLLAYASQEQQARWLPPIAAGDCTTSIAMSEPGTGSDLASISTTARRDGDSYVLSGAKTFISGGAQASLVLVIARTSPRQEHDRRAGVSILVVEDGMPGFSRGRTLDKLGLHAQDTTELFFDEVRVPAANLLGAEGAAFGYLLRNLPQERLTIAVGSQAAAAAAIQLTTSYVRERHIFGQPLGSFQNTKFVLAGCSAEAAAGQALVDAAIEAHDHGELTAADAARVKLFTTEMQARVVDRCLQLFGGYGFTRDYPISRLYADARVTRIYGGSSEVMKSIISKDLGL